jgi:hypothetical protein
MPEVEETLDWIVKQTEGRAERFNDRLAFEAEEQRASRKRKPALPKPIDADVIREGAQPPAQSASEPPGDMAHGRGAADDGAHQRALVFAGRGSRWSTGRQWVPATSVATR